MSETSTLKCPACGAYLVLNPQTQAFTCPFCDASFTKEELDKASPEAMRGEPAQGEREYHCQSCGAEVVTDETTAATFCYYCHNPVTLMDRVSREFTPDGVVPFTISKESALERFHNFLKKKKFLRKDFFTPDALEKFSGVYYPYWLGDVMGEGDYHGKGTRSSVASTPKYDVITTKHYDIHRTGKLSYHNIVRKALEKNDRKLSDGIHPYQLEDVKPFSPAYLSGFLAEKRDVEEDTAKQEMLREASDHAEALMSQGLTYETLSGDATFTPTGTKMRCLLLPTWVLTYRGDRPGTTFFYMMNAQTGTVCGKLPIHWGKLMTAAAICGLAVAGLLCLGGALLW